MLPQRVELPGDRVLYAPWAASSVEVVRRFATSAQRIRILGRWLAFRGDLAGAGFVNGFQWLDGSFVERREAEPRDLDVVTFCHRPAALLDDHEGLEMVLARLGWFDHKVVKPRDGLDLRLVDLSFPSPETLVEDAAQWSALYGHRRDALGKGFLRVPLASPTEDAAASAELEVLEHGGAT